MFLVLFLCHLFILFPLNLTEDFFQYRAVALAFPINTDHAVSLIYVQNVLNTHHRLTCLHYLIIDQDCLQANELHNNYINRRWVMLEKINLPEVSPDMEYYDERRGHLCRI